MEASEKRGPVEKGEKGWPINPIGVVILLVFALIVVFLIAKPLLSRTSPNPNQQQVSQGGHIVTPQAGQIIHGDKLSIELSVDNPGNTQSVQFWAKAYAGGNWQMIGTVKSAPYKLDWQIPSEFQNKAIAITTHIETKSGNEIKDPGGWREGIIILSQ